MPIVLLGADGQPEAEAVGADGAVLEPTADGQCEECTCEGAPPILYRRWCPCEQPGCWPGHLDLWIPETVPPIRPCLPAGEGFVIVVGTGSGRWCYQSTGVRLDISNIPPGSQVVGINVSAAAIDCANSPVDLGCPDPICTPAGGGGDCPCACDQTCFVPDYSAGDFHRPPEPGDAPCRICCWRLGSMSFSWHSLERQTKQQIVFTPGYPGCDGIPPGLCALSQVELRSGRPLTPADPEWGPLCASPSCLGCYKRERRVLKQGCVFPESDSDTGWVDDGVVVLQIFTPGEPIDTGYVSDYVNVCSLPGGGPDEIGLFRTRFWQIQNCGTSVTEYSEQQRRAAVCGPGGVACVLDERVLRHDRFTQTGAGSECCGGCRQEYCGNLETGGGCPPLVYPIEIPGGGLGGGGLEPGDGGGGGPIMPGRVVVEAARKAMAAGMIRHESGLWMPAPGLAIARTPGSKNLRPSSPRPKRSFGSPPRASKGCGDCGSGTGGAGGGGGAGAGIVVNTGIVKWASKFWVGLTGAEKYAAAITTGDVAGEADVWARGSKCAECMSKTCSRPRTLAGFEVLPRMVFCGPPLEEFPESVLPTCGCLVLVEAGQEDQPPDGVQAITINGVAYQPAGKVMVASEACPQGRWRQVPRRA